LSAKKQFRKLEIPGWFTSPPDTAIEFDGKRYSARSGEPLTITLLAHGVHVLGAAPNIIARAACSAVGAPAAIA